MSVEWLLVVLAVGVNCTFWGVMAVLRIAESSWTRGSIHRLGHATRRHAGSRSNRTQHAVLGDPDHPGVITRGQLTLGDIAVLIAAHNEEQVIGDSLASIARLLPRSQVYVVSDGSTDRTVDLARRSGVRVIETPTNVGKAGALQEGIRQFRLVERYQAVLLLDADTQLDPHYFEAALPLFDDRKVVAVAGCVQTEWSPLGVSLLGRLLISHRARIYAVTQRLIKIGQTWRRTNALYIVPGFASIYRTQVLSQIDINPPGLVIEDFNMTFELYRQKLGRVGFTMAARAKTQDPDRFGDYVRQTKRWCLGFWQTVRRYRPRLSLFTAMLVLLVFELLTSSVVLVLLPFALIFAALPNLFPGLLTYGFFQVMNTYVDIDLVLLAVGVPDLLLTLVVAAVERRPRYLLFAPAFLPLRMIDAAIALYTLPRAWAERSTGRWVSPQRRVR